MISFDEGSPSRQSPEFDRRWPRDKLRIVAMAANGMQGDRPISLAAGMEAYVAKPIRVDRFVRAPVAAPSRERVCA